MPEEQAYRPWPSDLIYPPTCPHLANLVRWIVANAPAKQPEATCLGVLTVLSAVMGNRYTVRGQYCNLYSMVLMASGDGKEAIHKGINDFLTLIQMLDISGASSLDSNGGMLAELQEKCGVDATGCGMFWNIDEMGQALKAMVAPRGASYQGAMMKVLLELYNRRAVFKKRLKDSSLELRDPCIAVYGGCQPRIFWRDIDNDDLNASGLNGRFLFVVGNPDVYHGVPDAVVHPLDADTLQYFKAAVAGMTREIGNTEDILHRAGAVKEKPTKYCIPVSVEVENALKAQADKQHEIILQANKDGKEDFATARKRDIQTACKVAGIYAWAKSHSAPSVDMEAWNWAWRFVTNAYEGKEAQAVISKISTREHEIAREILANVRSYGPAGLTKSELYKNMTKHVGILERMLQHMIVSGDISAIRQPVTASCKRAEFMVYAKEYAPNV